MKLEALDFEDLDRFRIRLFILGGVVILIFSLLHSQMRGLILTVTQIIVFHY